MSWSISIPITPAEDFDAAVDAAVLQGPNTEEHQRQASLAKHFIKLTVALGAVGAARQYAASASGHANANHQPTAGWSNSALTVSVQQVP